jgi:hypothetical protein
LHVIRIQRDALAMYSLPTYNHTILPYEGGWSLDYEFF